MSPPPPMPGPPAAPIPPRRTSPLVWILVAVLGLFVMGGIAVMGVAWYAVHKVKQAGIDPEMWRRNPGLATGKMLAAINPNLEVVNTDDNTGTITIRDRRTGKQSTITFDQAKAGRFTINTEDDNGRRASMEFGAAGKPPSWVPDYPGSHPAYSIRGSAEGGDEGGNFTFTTDDSPSRVMDFYQDKIKEAGMETKVTSTTGEGGMIVASRDSDDRTLTVVVARNSGSTTVNVTYSRKR